MTSYDFTNIPTLLKISSNFFINCNANISWTISSLAFAMKHLTRYVVNFLKLEVFKIFSKFFSLGSPKGFICSLSKSNTTKSSKPLSTVSFMLFFLSSSFFSFLLSSSLLWGKDFSRFAHLSKILSFFGKIESCFSKTSLILLLYTDKLILSSSTKIFSLCFSKNLLLSYNSKKYSFSASLNSMHSQVNFTGTLALVLNGELYSGSILTIIKECSSAFDLSLLNGKINPLLYIDFLYTVLSKFFFCLFFLPFSFCHILLLSSSPNLHWII